MTAQSILKKDIKIAHQNKLKKIGKELKIIGKLKKENMDNKCFRLWLLKQFSNHVSMRIGLIKLTPGNW